MTRPDGSTVYFNSPFKWTAGKVRYQITADGMGARAKPWGAP